MAVSEHLIDKRVIERSLTKSKLERAEYEAYLEALPDVSHNIARIELQPAPRRSSAPPRPSVQAEPQPAPQSALPSATDTPSPASSATQPYYPSEQTEPQARPSEQPPAQAQPEAKPPNEDQSENQSETDTESAAAEPQRESLPSRPPPSYLGS